MHFCSPLQESEESLAPFVWLKITTIWISFVAIRVEARYAKQKIVLREELMLQEGIFRDPEHNFETYVHCGVPYAPGTTAEFIERIENFPINNNDVVVVGYPKSGTNWLAIVLANLYPEHWETTKITIDRQIPDLCVASDKAAKFQGFDECLAAPSPRLMKSHLQFDHMPRAFRESGKGKVVYVRRNPKDSCDSGFTNHQLGLGEAWTWEHHVDAFLEGKVFFGKWTDNVLSWQDKTEADGVLNLVYEDMKRDKPGALRRVVDFLGIPIEDGAIERVIAATGFEAMKKNGLDRQYQVWMTRREGGSGGWKKRFTVAQSEKFDAELGPILRAHGIAVTYD